MCDPRTDNHPEDDGVEGELDQNAAGCRDGLGHGLEEALGPPVQNHADGDEDQVIGVEIQRREGPLGISGRRSTRYQSRSSRHQYDQDGAVLQPLAGFLPWLRSHIDRFKLKAEILHRLGPFGSGAEK